MSGAKVLFAVAVGQTAGPNRLDRLPGAWIAARAMVAWAEAAGFDAYLVDDADGTPVTIGRLRQSFQPVLAAPAGVEHLIFYFAGHGFSRGTDDQYLLLSHWQSDANEAIVLRRLPREVSLFGVRRLSRIVDACSSLPTAATDDVHGAALFATGIEKDNRADEDVFQASVHGREAFMLRASAGEQPICLYTAVVLQALAGIEPADAAGARDAVRSQDIARHLKTSFAGIATRYGVKPVPRWMSSFLPPDDVYARLPVAFTPPPLPEPKAAIAQAARELEGELTPEPASRAAEAMLEQLATTLEAGIRTRGTLSQSKGGLRMAGKAVGWAIDRVIDMAPWGRRKRRRASIEVRRKPPPRQPTSAARALTTLVTGAARPARDEMPGLTAFRAAGTEPPLFVRRGAATVALGLPGGRVVPLHHLPGCHTNAYLGLMSDGGGALALDWRPADRTAAEEDDAQAFFLALADDRLATAENAPQLAGMAPERLVARHPMAAVLQAYLADAAGDHGTVLTLAEAFRTKWEAMPFDLALLAGIAEPDLVTGRFPLLPAGWQLLPFARLPVHPALADLAAGLVPAFPFATLQGPAAARLLALIQAQEI
jgi:hypothetical protein